MTDVVDEPAERIDAEARTRGIVHEHTVVVAGARGDRDQPVAHALGAVSATNRQKLDALAVDPKFMPARISGCDDDEDRIDACLGEQRVDRMLEHRAFAQAQVLLRQFSLHARTDAGRGDQRDVTQGTGHESDSRREVEACSEADASYFV